jgi:AP-1-like factor
MTYTPKDFTSSLVALGHQSGGPDHRVTVNEETGERLLNTGATWDMIQAHPLSQKGMVNVADVCERLKSHARCDGQGPVFEEGLIRRVIEESSAAGYDELI